VIIEFGTLVGTTMEVGLESTIMVFWPSGTGRTRRKTSMSSFCSATSYFFGRLIGVKLALRGVIVDVRVLLIGAGEGGTIAPAASSFLARFVRSIVLYG
jgi:hypothetical protein